MALKWPPMVLVAHAALGGAWVGAAAPKNKWRGGVGPSRRTLAAAPCALQPGNGFHSPSVSKIYRRLRIHGSRCREGLGGAGKVSVEPSHGPEAAAGSHEVRTRVEAAG